MTHKRVVWIMDFVAEQQKQQNSSERDKES